MAVYYRSMCSRDTFPLPVAAPSISVGELKGLIMETGRYGHGRTRGRSPRESITISNEQGEEYADDSALVLRNSTVVVRRRVAGPPADRIVLCPSDIPPLCPRSRQDSGGSSSNSASRSAGNQDDQAKATSAVIDNGRGAAHKGRAPPAGYVCHRCRIPGHFIQHCPTNGDSRFDFGRAPVPAPGPADESNDDGFPADLHCRICKEVMADAVVASKCCFNSFCDRCIRAHIVANCKCACGAKASADDLIPNPTLRTTISNILAARASSASSGAGKQSSSAASNEALGPFVHVLGPRVQAPSLVAATPNWSPPASTHLARLRRHTPFMLGRFRPTLITASLHPPGSSSLQHATCAWSPLLQIGCRRPAPTWLVTAAARSTCLVLAVPSLVLVAPWSSCHTQHSNNTPGRSLESLTDYRAPTNIKDLIQGVQEEFDEYDAGKLNRIFLTLQTIMVEVMNYEGGNSYKIPHLRKERLE
ncbi:E3 ubiquitin ligase PARAQUAT TOLERANCE 3-like [Triticum dicoccoides]|uniref:E3 ubiquitin ligase PARAQUAT TOLERANCE 3-like n=1 Tax=Triticum dicoccoides TaxID=85692 RepID=UPI001890182C|nr:E3 ubiquitin ligase PARAQUAT TOLERANCE 3-like [Triticum dicoccoides]